MNGSVKLTDEEKLKIDKDEKNNSRMKAFQTAQISTQKGSLDELHRLAFFKQRNSYLTTDNRS